MTLKNAAAFDQRQVPDFDIEQQPTKGESLWSLLHTATDEHDDAKAKNKPKTSSAKASSKKVKGER